MDTMIRIRDYAELYYADHGCSPSTTMIADEVGVSRGTAYKYLVEMAEKGIIAYDGKRIVTNITRNSNVDRSNAPIVGAIRCGYTEERTCRETGIRLFPASIFGYGDFYILKAMGIP
jgi:repressor LexA